VVPPWFNRRTDSYPVVCPLRSLAVTGDPGLIYCPIFQRVQPVCSRVSFRVGGGGAFTLTAALCAPRPIPYLSLSAQVAQTITENVLPVKLLYGMTLTVMSLSIRLPSFPKVINLYVVVF
jgi:hypothetical protein